MVDPTTTMEDGYKNDQGTIDAGTVKNSGDTGLGEKSAITELLAQSVAEVGESLA